MDYYCEVCDKYIKPNSKYKHLKSIINKGFDKYKHLILTLKDIEIKKQMMRFVYTL